MKNRIFALAALGVCTAVSAWAINQTEVDVVSNLTAHGEHVEHPTTAHPVYYLPVISGYMEPINPVGIGRETPPSIESVEHVVEAALARQGYHPSRGEIEEVLFRWCRFAQPPATMLASRWLAGYHRPRAC